MTAIDVGSAATDRASFGSTGITYIDLTNPVEANGVISTVEVFVYSPGPFKVGTFAYTSPGVYFCRAVVDLGSLSVGYHSFTGLNLTAAAGDYIGSYSVSGRMEAGSVSGAGVRQGNGDNCVAGTYFNTTLSSPSEMSVYGSGDTYVPPENEAEIASILDVVLESYAPAVGHWYSNNWFYRENPDFIIATLLYALLTGGIGGGGGVTLAQLRTEMDTRIGVSVTSPAFSADQIMYDIGVSQAPATGLLAAIMNHDNSVYERDLVHDADIKQAIDDKVVATPTDVSNSEWTITNAIGQLNDVSLTDITTVVNAARDHVEGVPAHNLKDISDEIAAIPAGDNTAVLNAISNLDGDVVDLHGDVANLDGDVAAAKAVIDNTHSDLEAAKAAIDALTVGGESNLYPGSSGVTPSTPVEFAGPLEITRAMDGVYVEITSEPAGTGKDECSDHLNWRHAGWIAFLADGAYGDELQWLGLDAAVYVPKRLLHATGCLIFPRANSSGTITPFTRNA